MSEYSPIALFPPTYGGAGMLSALAVNDGKAVPATPVRAQPATPRPPWTGSLAYSGQFPGFGLGSPFLTPRLLADMRRSTPVTLVHGAVTEPILAGTQAVVVDDDGGNPDLAETIRRAAVEDLIPALKQALPGALEAPCFGHWLQEVVWSKRNGRVYPAELRSVLPTEGVIFIDGCRRFTGYSVFGTYRDSRYGFLAVNDPHWDPVLGRSENEAAVPSYLRALRSIENADSIERRASGIQFLFHVMQGVEVVDASGNPIDALKLVTDYMNAAVTGKSGIVPDMFFSKEAIEKSPELAKIPYFRAEKFEWGENGPALEAHLSRLEKLESDIYAAWKVPKLAIAERSKAGLGQASSGDHSDVVLCISEKYHARYIGQFDCQVSLRWMRANYANSKVRIHIEPAPLADPQQTFLQDFVKTRITATAVDPNIDSNVDWRKVLERVEVPTRSVEDAAAVLAKAQADAQQQAVDLAKAKGPPQVGDEKAEADGNTDVAGRADAEAKEQAK